MTKKIAIIEVQEVITHHIPMEIDGVLDEDIFDYAEEHIDELTQGTIDNPYLVETEISVQEVLEIEEEE